MSSSSIPLLCVLLIALRQPSPIHPQHNAHFLPNRSAIVQLFEWPHADVARECEQFLGPHCFAGVQISSVIENLAVPGRPWYERYQPLSYRFVNRSGTRAQLADMVRRCNAAGVRVYVDVVLNHMAGGPELRNATLRGTGGSVGFYGNLSYPAVPYEAREFHRECAIDAYTDAHVVRNCFLQGLPDLDQSVESVRAKMAASLSEMVELGVAGFRVGACKHMWPNDLKLIYARVRGLVEEGGFERGARPLMMQEVGDNGLEPISK